VVPNRRAKNTLKSNKKKLHRKYFFDEYHSKIAVSPQMKYSVQNSSNAFHFISFGMHSTNFGLNISSVGILRFFNEIHRKNIYCVKESKEPRNEKRRFIKCILESSFQTLVGICTEHQCPQPSFT
jgi:preprotein translocase subunit Sec61beta